MRMDLLDDQPARERIAFMRSSAAALRADASVLEQATTRLIWQSHAAGRFRSRLTGYCSNLRRLAGVLDDTADHLAAHLATAQSHQRVLVHTATETVRVINRVVDLLPLGVLP